MTDAKKVEAHKPHVVEPHKPHVAKGDPFVIPLTPEEKSAKTRLEIAQAIVTPTKDPLSGAIQPQFDPTTGAPIAVLKGK